MDVAINMQETSVLRDLIYLDIDKLYSINSQLSGGLVQTIQATTQNTRNLDGGINISVAKLGGTATDTKSFSETKTPHHEVLEHVENTLFDLHFAVDLNKNLTSPDVTSEEIRKSITDVSYVKAEGWSIVRDYKRIGNFADNINSFYGFFNESSRRNLNNSDTYKQLLEQISNLNNQIKAEKDRNRKALLKIQLDQLTKQQEQVQKAVQLYEPVEDWMMEGIKLYIDVLMTSEIDLHLYPFEEVPEFHISSTLKRKCFLESESDLLTFTYGSQPNVKLTLFGLITSIPSKTKPWSPETAISGDTTQSDMEKIATAFKQIFNALSDIEKFGTLSWYPSIALQPIALYRSIRRNT